MLFNSFEFIIFLPVVFCLYWFVSRGRLAWQNGIILLSSYLFYGWLDWKMLGLILLTSSSTYLSALYIDKNEGRRGVQKLINTANIFVNISVLCAFKYFNFFAENFARLFRIFGMEMDWVTQDILLPIGISFYTFTALSYSIDVYMKRIKAERNPLTVFSYIAFFPQLLAGPIARATKLVPQFKVSRKFDYPSSVEGMRQLLWGLFKKIVIADNLNVFVGDIFNNYQNEAGSTLLLGAFYFTIQLYCDFSGYSDMAIGIAKLFGINLLQNFSTPFFSRNVAEFWRRWHISLNTWFRDYIYIPLGGSRKGTFCTIRNTMIIFLVCGFWHGANWTFIFWGAYNGLLFIPLILTGRNLLYKDNVAENRVLPNIKEAWHIIVTFALVMFGMVIFRADNMLQALFYIGGIFKSSLFMYPNYLSKIHLGLIIVMFAVEWFSRRHEFEFYIKAVKYKWVRRVVYLVILLLIFVCGKSSESFIYFNF